MTNNLIFSVITAAILLSGCRKEDGGIANLETCYSNSNAYTILHDGLNREYLLYIPNAYDGATPAPLMLNFHGFGGSASEFMKEADMRSLAESNGFILAYPQGSCSEGFSHWNPCPLEESNKSDADDFGFVEALISEISRQYNVDQMRVYAAGYSNGGMMAYGLANYNSQLIAAVASVSGTMLDCIGNTEHPMPVLHLHGTSDAVIPYNGNNYYSSTQRVLDHWINFNNTNTTPVINSDNSSGITIEHLIYDQGDSLVSVEHYKYIGANHAWFDATVLGQNTSELIWNFVSRYDIDGLRD